MIFAKHVTANLLYQVRDHIRAGKQLAAFLHIRSAYMSKCHVDHYLSGAQFVPANCGVKVRRNANE